MDEAIIVLITVPSVEMGKHIARELLERKLAACVNVVSPICSLYTWQGEIHEDEEALLIVKTRASLFEEGLVPAVTALHPYQVPEIIATPITKGLQNYLGWISQSTSEAPG